MARKTEQGSYIISAGEVGAYTVCPEAWRLQSIVKVKISKAGNNLRKEGRVAHDQWAKKVEKAIFLRRDARRIIYILFLVILIVLFLISHIK